MPGTLAEQHTLCKGLHCSVQESGFAEFNYNLAGIGCSRP